MMGKNGVSDLEEWTCPELNGSAIGSNKLNRRQLVCRDQII